LSISQPIVPGAAEDEFAMSEIGGPRTPPDHLNRLLPCEEFMEKAFNAAADDLVARAVAGSEAAEAEEAVLSPAQNRRWAALENEQTAGTLDEI
jgi:hypothetical protein